jgi:sodium/proline symporter
VLIGAGVVLLYGMLGGFWAISVTDMLQGLVMAIIAIILPTAAFFAAGGWDGIFTSLAANAPEAYLSATGLQPALVFLGFVLGIASIGLGPFGQPHLISRLMALKDDKSRHQGFAIAMGWAVIVYVGMTILALSARALFGSLEDGESLFYRVASELLPAALAGIVIASVLSAVMSTVDSILLSASAAVAHDMGLARRYPGKELLVSRAVMVSIAVLAVILTLTLDATIFDRVLFAWSALGAAFGPIVLTRVLNIEPEANAILLAMVSGFAMTVLFYALGQAAPMANPVMETLRSWAALPGDPFERFVPWIAPMLILWIWRQR